jgi:hypothetical protein
MNFHALLVVFDGRAGGWQATTTDILRDRIHRWALRAQGISEARRAAA